MTRLIGRAFLIIALLGCFSPAYAQADAAKADHDKLRALKTKAADAFNKRDGQAIASCFTKNFAITTIDQTPLTSAAEIDGHFNKIFKSPNAPILDMKISPEADILTVFFDADNGFCYGKNHETYTMKDGRVVPMESRWTAVVHRENNEWKIAAIHAGVNFLDNPVLAKSDAQAKMTAVAGFVVGVLSALLGFRLFLRRKARTSSN